MNCVIVHQQINIRRNLRVHVNAFDQFHTLSVVVAATAADRCSHLISKDLYLVAVQICMLSYMTVMDTAYYKHSSLCHWSLTSRSAEYQRSWSDPLILAISRHSFFDKLHMRQLINWWMQSSDNIWRIMLKTLSPLLRSFVLYLHTSGCHVSSAALLDMSSCVRCFNINFVLQHVACPQADLGLNVSSEYLRGRTSSWLVIEGPRQRVTWFDRTSRGFRRLMIVWSGTKDPDETTEEEKWWNTAQCVDIITQLSIQCCCAESQCSVLRYECRHRAHNSLPHVTFTLVVGAFRACTVGKLLLTDWNSTLMHLQQENLSGWEPVVVSVVSWFHSKSKYKKNSFTTSLKYDCVHERQFFHSLSSKERRL